MHRIVGVLMGFVVGCFGADLVINVEHITSKEGKVLLFVHDNASEYHADDDTTDEDFNAFHWIAMTPSAETMTAVFHDLPEGRYAISSYHDEDGDGGLDRHYWPFVFLMPSEAYGVGNNAYAYFSKASFDDACIELKAPVTEVNVRLSHHLRKIIGQ